jgi:gas vesicle protein
MLKVYNFKKENKIPQVNHIRKGSSLIRLLAGGGSGAIIALLFAPRSGKSLRRKIKNKTDDYYEEMKDVITDVKMKANDLITNGLKYQRNLTSKLGL